MITFLVNTDPFSWEAFLIEQIQPLLRRAIPAGTNGEGDTITFQYRPGPAVAGSPPGYAYLTLDSVLYRLGGQVQPLEPGMVYRPAGTFHLLGPAMEFSWIPIDVGRIEVQARYWKGQRGIPSFFRELMKGIAKRFPETAEYGKDEVCDKAEEGTTREGEYRPWEAIAGVRKREVVKMWHQGMDFEKIAKCLNLATGTVRNQLSQLRHRYGEWVVPPRKDLPVKKRYKS